MKTIGVLASSGPYEIRIARGLLPVLGSVLRDLFPPVLRVGIVSNPVVWGLYGPRIREALEGAGFRIIVALHPDGERYKTMESVMGLLGVFLGERWERREPILVAGGGVTGDMGGLAAALLLRGVPLVHLPTTVVAQVDSSIGGKTGVDHPLGKNLIGAFNPPRAILSDSEVLGTLPLRERRAGLGEVLKYALIGDGALLDLLEERVEELASERFDGELWERVVTFCSADKARIVSNDERESGERMLLNFGHTFGHALEGALDFSGLLHGEAVAIGMLSAAAIAESGGIAAPGTFSFIKSLTSRAGLPSAWPLEVTFEQIHPYLVRDKKVTGGQVALILPEAPGRVRIVRDYDPNLLPRGLFA
ncbi:MAG: 3-dehydroquinate synthase [Nitrospiraceae bacterium]|nr:3-dehydroquinate synthase [Nitrospiraceae bacterium]